MQVQTAARGRQPVIGLLIAGVMALVAALLPAVLTATPAAADHVTPARVEGQTAPDTAASIASLTFSAADTAHLVTGEDFPDALAASFAAGHGDGPILLTSRDDVPDATWDALDDLGVATVVLVGGTEAISSTVDVDLQLRGYTTDRISGADRYATAASVAVRSGGEHGVGTLDGERIALLASGEDFPDALAAGPIAARMHYPLLLTPHDSVNAGVFAALSHLDVDRVLLLGGQAAVLPSVADGYREHGYTVERIAGANRAETATAVAELARTRLGWETPRVLLSRGDDFPDALAGSVHGGQLTAPVLLSSSPTDLGEATAGWLRQRCPDVEAVRALGGTAAVAVGTLADAIDAASACAHPSDGTAPVGDPRTEAYQSPDFPRQFGETRLLSDVRAAGHDGFDRFVLEFADADEPPPFRIEYRQPPVYEQPRGRELDVAGDAFLHLAVHSSSTYVVTGDEHERSYEGPLRLEVPDGAVIQEVAQTSDWENVMTWAIGLADRSPYSVTTLHDPVRLVIDVRPS